VWGVWEVERGERWGKAKKDERKEGSQIYPQRTFQFSSFSSLTPSPPPNTLALPSLVLVPIPTSLFLNHHPIARIQSSADQRGGGVWN